MHKLAIAIGALLSFGSIQCAAQGVSVQVGGGDGYYDDDYYDDYSYWYGPGWYWGVYFDNENDYYGYGNRHFPHHWNDQNHGGNHWHGGGGGSQWRGGGHGAGHGGGGGGHH